MSTVIAKNVQVGTSGTATDNFTIFQPATPDGTLRIGNGNTGITTSQVALTSAGNVGIGTSSPASQLDVSKTGDAILSVTSAGVQRYQLITRSGGNFEVYDQSNAATRIALTQAGLFQFNSGYGSVATAYGCRAWVNFNGTGTVAIRASGNVTSITDNATGDYTVNFTTAMPDANYSAVFGVLGQPTSGRVIMEQHDSPLRSTTQIRIYTLVPNTGATADSPVVSVSILR
jgi:hypothetical protein